MLSLVDCPIAEQTWLEEARQMDRSSAPQTRMQAVRGGQREVQDAGPWEPAVAKMVEFQHLGDNWDGLGAPAPSRELLVSAIGLAYTLKDKGIDPPSRVVASLEGSVTLEWHDPSGTYIEVEIVRPFYAEVMMIERGQPARHWTLPTE